MARIRLDTRRLKQLLLAMVAACITVTAGADQILLDNGATQLNVGTTANDGTGDTMRAGALKMKQWAADLNTMNTELYAKNTGAYNLAQPVYGLALDGTTDDGPAAAAALATIGTGKVVILPAGKTLLTCRPLSLPAGTTLLGYGATIKRCPQPSGVTTDTDVSNGTTSITVSNGALYLAGQVIALRGATYRTDTATIASVAGNVITLSAGFANYGAANDTAYAGTITEQLTVYRVGYLTVTGGPHVTVKGLTYDGNSSNFAAACRWTWCTEIEVNQSFTTIEDATFINAPGEAIQEGAIVTGSTNTDLTPYVTTAIVSASSWVTQGFAVGDLITLDNTAYGGNLNGRFNDGARRITSFSTTTVANDTLNISSSEPFNIPLGAATTDNGIRVFRLNEGNRYLNNTFKSIDGNAVHFSAHAGVQFSGNTIWAANLDSGVGHQYGYVTFSCYTYDTQIQNNVLDGGVKFGIGIQGCGNDSILIAGNDIRLGDGGTSTAYAIDVQVVTSTSAKRINITNNLIETRVAVGNAAMGVRVVGGAVVTPSATQADPDGPARIQIVGNQFKLAGFVLQRAQRILVANNTFDFVGDNSVSIGTVDDTSSVTIANNTFNSAYQGLSVLSNLNKALSVRGNTFTGQIATGIMFAGTDQDAVIEGNTFTVENVSRTNSAYVGIDALPRRAHVLGNNFFVEKGAACIRTYNGTIDFSAAGYGTVVSGNVCRRASGTLTDSINVRASNTGLIVAGNWLWEALTDAGTATVTTPANVVIP